MSRQIDITKPLDDAELKYLHDRSMWRELRQYAENMGLPQPNLPDAANVRRQDPRTGVNAVRLPSALEELRTMSKETKPDKEGAPLADRSSEQNPDPATGSAATPTDYRKLTVPQLQEELDKRRKEYEESGDKEGVDAVSYTKEDRKEDLVVMLEEDDRESTTEGSQS